MLQADQKLPVWGIAKPNARVVVELGKRRGSSQADEEGDWRVEFEPTEASEKPVELIVKCGGEKITRKNLIFGDIWLATGQSNMRWMLKQCATGKDAITDSQDDGLRLLRFAGTLHPGGKKYPLEYLKKLTPQNYYASDGWQVSSPKSTPEFSGVGYFFAKALRRDVKRPIGVIQLAVGGSPIEAHLPRSAFNDPKLAPYFKDWWKSENYPVWCRGRAALNLTHWFANPPEGRDDPPHPFAPTFLWQAGIKPLIGFPIKGVIWYQGESNAGKDGSPGSITDGSINKLKLKTLINSYRKAWGNPDLPFIQAQLPGLNRQWPVFREMQLETTQEMKNVGMAVTIDVGHPTNVHPNRKKPVGERMARLARSLPGGYGDKELVPNGPIYERKCIFFGSLYVRFKNAKILKTSDGKEFRGFEIAGEDQVFHPAKVDIHGGAVLKISSEKVPQPKAVRYAWENDPDCNLVNEEGLPASPFRTDRWKNVEPSGNVKK